MGVSASLRPPTINHSSEKAQVIHQVLQIRIHILQRVQTRKKKLAAMKQAKKMQPFFLLLTHTFLLTYTFIKDF